MIKYLLDTNIFSYLFRERTQQDSHPVKSKLEKVLKANAQILVCPVVFYEIVRGLYKRDTRSDLQYFLLLVEQFEWCEFSQETWDTGAQLWAKCRQKRQVTRNDKENEDIDIDVLIAAQVREQDAILVTNNTRHFKHFDIHLENWQTQRS